MKKKIKLGFVLAFCYFTGVSQVVQINWLNSNLSHEYARDCSCSEETNEFLFNINRLKPDAPPAPQPINAFYDYHHIIYRTDSLFNITDSVYLDEYEQYKLYVHLILKNEPDLVLLAAFAFDTIEQKQDGCLIWLNGELNIYQVGFYGSPGDDDNLHAAAINHNGNVVMNHGYLLENNQGGVGHFYEIDMQGNILVEKTDTCAYWMLNNIHDLPGIQRYSFLQGERIYLVDYSLNLDTVINENGLSWPIGNYLFLTEEEILWSTEYYVGAIPDPFCDVGLFFANIGTGIYDSIQIGVPDTNDMYGRICRGEEGIIYLACTKNMTFPVYSDTWLSVYKVDVIEKEIIGSYHYGGYGVYYPQKIMPLQDGNLLIFGSFYDFHNYPGILAQDDVFILKIDSDVITVDLPEVCFLEKVGVFPNPFRNFVKFELPEGKKITLKVTDIYGTVVFSDEIENQEMIDLSHLKSGLYFYTLSHQSIMTGSGKLVKLR